MFDMFEIIAETCCTMQEGANYCKITPKVYGEWRNLMNTIKSSKEVSLVVSVDNLQKLTKNDSLEKFELKPLVDESKIQDEHYLKQIQKEL